MSDFVDKAKEKAQDLVGQNEERIESTIDKAKEFVDDKTGGRFSEQIDKAADAARSTVSNIAPEPEGEEGPPSKLTP